MYASIKILSHDSFVHEWPTHTPTTLPCRPWEGLDYGVTPYPKFTAAACSNPLIDTRIAPVMITGFLPTKSERTPATNVPKRLPTANIDTITP